MSTKPSADDLHMAIVVSRVLRNEISSLTEKCQRDELQARIAQANVHASGRTARAESAEVEPFGHKRLVWVQGLHTRAGSVRVKGIVSRSKGGY